jgi:AcrR family transcriptional regulator
MAQAGRRPGPTSTAERILDAARELFAERGFDGTTIRAVAARAEVNPAIVHHFFGSKDDLFTAAVNLPLNPVDILTELAKGPPETLPERLARFVVHAWRDPKLGPALQSALRGVLGSQQGGTIMRRFAEDVVLVRVSAALGLPKIRLAAALSQILGFAVVGQLLGVEPLASASEDELVALYAPALRALLDG